MSALELIKAKLTDMTAMERFAFLVLKPLDIIASQVYYWVLWFLSFVPRFGNGGQSTTTKNESQCLLDSSSKEIKILSHNIWYHFVAGGMHRKKRMDVFFEFLRIDQPHIICLQELFAVSVGLFTVSDWDYLIDGLRPMGYHYYTNPKKGAPFLKQNHGLAIISKFPLIGTKEFVFRKKRWFDLRGWLETTVRIPVTRHKSVDLFLITTHFEHIISEYKLSQMQQICDRLKVLSHVPNRMCCGDFNLCSNYTWNDIYDRLVESMTQCGLKNDLFAKTERTFRILNDKTETNGSYDHMFVTDPIKRNVTHTQITDYEMKKLAVSDHYGIMATVDLKQLL